MIHIPFMERMRPACTPPIVYSTEIAILCPVQYPAHSYILGQMLNITEKNNGIEFEILARPKSRRNGVLGLHDGALKIAVTAPPEKGRANAAIVKELAEFLGVPVSRISIIAGETSRHKKVRVDGLSTRRVLDLVNAAIREEHD